ncbi:MAG: hypothetical protein IJY42_06795, partial [Clostridia bacterium]|nr:hypothetical protein [Clostridia bacterium]
MKNRIWKRCISILLSLLLFLGAFCLPLPVHDHDHGHDDHGQSSEQPKAPLLGGLDLPIQAWEEGTCEHCSGFIGDSWICSGGEHCGEDSDRTDCYEAWHCDT